MVALFRAAQTLPLRFCIVEPLCTLSALQDFKNDSDQPQGEHNITLFVRVSCGISSTTHLSSVVSNWAFATIFGKLSDNF